MFVQFNDEAEGLAVFAADECIRRWDEVEMLFIDSSFFIIPHGFAQTLAVTGAIGNQFIQPAYALLSGKSETTYRLALRELGRAVNFTARVYHASTTHVRKPRRGHLMSGFAEFCMKKTRKMQAQGSNGRIHLKS
ncbi:hypothetical protein FOZ60_000346 [Perkinsus olseni]|uniref:MULE transposase domain-containing protein n=1 Tax=Perkinsus olseni TaxID=32597 RepID=A0A7J6MZR9_PEROL|nr:hypothetical protein FOZ60_000346 [Perkinsus olseni]